MQYECDVYPQIMYSAVQSNEYEDKYYIRVYLKRLFTPNICMTINRDSLKLSDKITPTIRVPQAYLNHQWSPMNFLVDIPLYFKDDQYSFKIETMAIVSVLFDVQYH